MASKTVEKNVRLEVLIFLVVFAILLNTSEGEESTHFVTSTKEVITSTNFPNSYPKSTERTWKFETTPGKKIILMFDYFNVESDSNCTRVYVALYDGESTNDTLLGRFCGSEKPPPVISKSHKLLMIFLSGYRTYKGFNATYTTECHQILKSKRGYEKSPNYPSQYPNSTECIWQFESTPGSRIILIFLYFDLEPSVECDSDYVAFYDGDSTDDMLLGRFCGNKLPAPIISTTNRMLMIFHSDSSNTKQGFNSHWLSTTHDFQSILKVTSTKSFAISPYYPRYYPSDAEKFWAFETTPGKKIVLMFDFFQLEYELNCTKDYVALYDGDFTNSTLIGRFCGLEKPPPIVSKGNKVLMIFHSDRYGVYKGFNATYATECHLIINSIGGTEKSPIYQGQYPNSPECIWNIESAPGNRIKLAFNTFDLEPHVDCKSDYVALYDGNSTNDMLLGRFCGSELPPSITSTTNRMLVVFHSGSPNTKRGFNFTHWTQSTHIVTSMKGIVTSPNYPDNFPNNAERIWNFETTPGKRIVIMFDYFSMESSSKCKKDYVSFYDGESTNSTLLAILCHYAHPIISTTHKMLMIFHSDELSEHKGFNATYSTECHQVIMSRQGEERSPNYPAQYPHSTECIWKFETDSWNKITVAFHEFDLEPNANCDSDYVALYDVNSTDYAFLGKYCGREFPPPFVSTANRMLVIFHSNKSNTDQGSKRIFRYTHKAQCRDQVVLSPVGVVTSHNYPEIYPMNLDCIWKFESISTQQITLVFDYFQMEFHTRCAYDYVQLYDGEFKNCTLLGQFCGNELPPPIVSTTNKMLMIFHSDGSTEYNGFRATHATGCNHFVNAIEGVGINFSYRNQSNQICTWEIETTPTNTIKLIFEYFKLQSSDNCSWNYVALYDRNSTNSTLLGKFCESEIPPPIISTTHKMLMVFYSDGHFYQSFRATFTDCYHVVKSLRGVVTSPNYPEEYPGSMNCIWKFEATSKQRITLIFDSFKLEKENNCASDYVAFYDGEYMNATFLGRFCGSKIPTPVISKTDKLFMIFHSDESNQYKGFTATHTTGCNHSVNTTEGVIDFTNTLQSNEICSWEIETTPVYTIQIVFDSFKLDSDDNCTSNYVAFYDYGAKNGNLLGKFCGNKIPPPIKSTAHKILMLFHSDGHSHQSFRAKHKIECNNVVKSLRGIVTSPNYPEEYQSSTNCIWKFESTSEQRITLIFDSFKLEEKRNCTSDYVAFYDGEYMNGTFLGRFCGSEIPPPIISKTDKLFMIFHSDESNQYKGFNATHTTGCNHVVNTTEGVIVFRNTRGNNEICSWEFETTPAYTIQLVFDSFELDSDDNCTYNYVAFYDYEAKNNGTLLGKFCGSKIPPPIKSTAHKMPMLFHSDGHSHQSFRAKHKTGLKAIVSDVVERNLIENFLKTRQETSAINKWGVDITLTTVALFLYDPQFFANGNETGEEIAYELTLQLMSKLVMKKKISTNDLALFINAMTVTCINPRTFFGLNVVAELRKRLDNTETANPFFILTLCNAGENITMKEVDNLQRLFRAHLRPSWTEIQAMIVMTLKCISRGSHFNLDDTLNEMVSELTKKQHNNGTIENLQNTALVIQALMATESYQTNFNLSRAIESILNDMKHKQVAIEEVYSFLPIIKWKSLLDINSDHCTSFIKTDLEVISNFRNHSDEQIQTQISIIIGDNMEFTRTWKIKVSANYSLYEALENFISLEPDYKIQYIISDGKPYVACIANFRDSTSKDSFWFLYTKPLSSTDDPVLVKISPVDIQVNETNELILWYRSGQWATIQETSFDITKPTESNVDRYIVTPPPIPSPVSDPQG